MLENALHEEKWKDLGFSDKEKIHGRHKIDPSKWSACLFCQTLKYLR